VTELYKVGVHNKYLFNALALAADIESALENVFAVHHGTHSAR